MIENFRKVFFTALRTVLPKLSGQVLEDRAITVGASDVAGCARRVILSKRSKEYLDEKTCMRFLNGHSREIALDHVHTQIAADQKVWVHSQVRVHDLNEPAIRAHIDRLYADAADLSEASQIYLFEEKNPEEISDEPRDSNLRQLQQQMGLVAENYPQAVVTGSVLETTHTDLEEFGVYEVDWAIYESLQERARALLWAIHSGATPDPEPGMECGWCAQRTDCPVWGSELPKQLPEEILEALHRLEEAAKTKKRAEAQQKALTKEITAALWGDQPPRRFKGQVAPGVWFERSTRKGRKTVSIESLETEHPDIAAEFVNEGNEYAVTQVKVLPQAPQTDAKVAA